jgi:dTDP-4-amino-4,6-dideoxygalactose transaminase
MNIPLSAPDVGEREVEYVNRVLRSSQLSMGPWLEKFEREFAGYVGTNHAIAVNSGTSGLHLCVRAMGIGANDEVITTSFSFVASVSCFLYEGALPVLVDIDPKTLNLDPAAVREFLRSQCTRSSEGALIDRQSGRVVKAIMPVHIFGLPCQMDALMEIAREYDLLVIEDACEAIGAEFDGQRTGTFGNAGVFAFYPNKQMTTGEGGMITTNDPRVAELCRSMRNQGRDTDGAWLRHVRIGYNYRLSELHAALGLAQLERIDEILAARAEIARRYSELLASQRQLQLLEDDPRVKRSWFVYIIRFRSGSPAFLRERVRTCLREHGVATQIYFTPIHLQPFYQKCQSGTVPSLPHTEQAAEECLALPFHTRLSEMEIKFVCDVVNQALETEKLQQATTRSESAPLVSTQVAET